MQGGPGWAVAVTKVNCEEVAAKAIKEAGRVVFAPIYKLMSRPRLGGRGGVRHSRPQIIGRPLFPGYVFIECEPGEELGPDAFNGVTRILHKPGRDGNAGLPKLVPAALIEEIRVKVEAGEFDKLPASKRIGASPGDKVRVTDGPFNSHIAELISIDDDKSRAVVLLSLFGRLSEVTIIDAPGCLELVEAAETA